MSPKCTVRFIKTDCQIYPCVLLGFKKGTEIFSKCTVRLNPIVLSGLLKCIIRFLCSVSSLIHVNCQIFQSVESGLPKCLVGFSKSKYSHVCPCQLGPNHTDVILSRLCDTIYQVWVILHLRQVLE